MKNDCPRYTKRFICFILYSWLIVTIKTAIRIPTSSTASEGPSSSTQQIFRHGFGGSSSDLIRNRIRRRASVEVAAAADAPTAEHDAAGNTIIVYDGDGGGSVDAADAPADAPTVEHDAAGNTIIVYDDEGEGSEYHKESFAAGGKKNGKKEAKEGNEKSSEQ